VGLSPLGTAATSGLLYKPQMINEGDCGAVGGLKIGRGNRNTRRKPAPAPLCPPQIPHDQTRARTRAAGVGSQRLTAWAMAQPILCVRLCLYFRLSHFLNVVYFLKGIVFWIWRRVTVQTQAHNSLNCSVFCIIYKILQSHISLRLTEINTYRYFSRLQRVG
jgi:hypothetical protein